MNRTFEFRVWDTQEKNWESEKNDGVYGWGTEGINLNDLIEYILSKRCNNDRNTARFVIQQFTGLTDKNGKKIFEGDIVKYFTYKQVAGGSHDFKNGKVEHLTLVEPDWEYHGALKPFHWADDSQYGNQDMAAKNCEVVGNIFET